MQCDENMLNYHYQQLDKTYCLSWHRATGMMVEEWCNYLDTYAKKRGRDLFFSINEWNVPCCFFDATNEKDWRKWMRKNSSTDGASVVPVSFQFQLGFVGHTT